jgi:hypothetical protein
MPDANAKHQGSPHVVQKKKKTKHLQQESFPLEEAYYLKLCLFQGVEYFS